MRRTTRVTAVLAAAATALALAGPAGAAPPGKDGAAVRTDRTGAVAAQAASFEPSARPVAQRPRPSRFALKAWGYGTKIAGGMLPVGVEGTAKAIISCTNNTGLRKQNEILGLNIPGVGELVGVARTEVWTQRKKGPNGVGVHAYSRHDLGTVTLAATDIGSLKLRALSSLSHVWHDDEGFHSEVVTDLGSLEIVFAPMGGEPQVFPLPSPGQPIEIPGLGKIILGHGVHKAGRNGARAYGNALKIEIEATGTKINLAHTSVSINDGITHGLLGGWAYGVEARALDGVVEVGGLGKTILPCRGTDGKEKSNDLVGVGAGSPLEQVATVGLGRTTVWGVQKRRRSSARTQAELANISLGGGALVIRGIKAVAAATRLKNGKVRTSSEGTSIGEVVFQGEPQAFPDPGVPLEIPGLASIQFNVVEHPGNRKKKNAIAVTALRITLLDGTGLVLNVGHARAKVTRSGL